MSMSITIDSAKFLAAVQIAPAKITTEVKKGISQALVNVQKEAAANHRYTTRTGGLEKATVLKVKDDFEAEVALVKYTGFGTSKTPVPYAYAIHNGRKNWKNYKPDPFLTNAGKSTKKDGEKIIKDSVIRGIRKAGL